MQKRKITKNSDPLWKALNKTFADPVVFRKGKNWDLLREGMKALD